MILLIYYLFQYFCISVPQLNYNVYYFLMLNRKCYHSFFTIYWLHLIFGQYVVKIAYSTIIKMNNDNLVPTFVHNPKMTGGNINT